MMRINLTAFPYDSEVIRYEKDGTPVYDRAVDSKVFRNIFLRYFTEGVDPNGGFTIVENSTQGALVKKGWANIRGVFIELKEDTAITFEAADSMDRIDRVILRHDDAKTVRKPDVIILKGTPSNSPQAPNITRNETQYDIVLADVRIRANSSVVTNTQITSQRLNTDLCGIITGTIKEVNTNDLYNQIKSDLSQFKESEQTEFLEWFESIKGKLGEDLAGNLQLQIDDLDSRTDVLEEATFTGEFSQVKSEFSGSASDYGIEVARIEGAYKQDGTPTPEQPIEPQFFHATSFNTNGGNLFDASKLPTKSQGGATVTNNGDGSFTISGNGSVTETFNVSYAYTHEETVKLLKEGILKFGNFQTSIPYIMVGLVNEKGVWTKAIENRVGTSSRSINILKKDLNNPQLRLKMQLFAASSHGNITNGLTIKPVLCQDGDGTFYPFNASSTPVDIELRALPNGVKDTCENGVITRRVGYYDSYNSEQINGSWISSTGELSVGAKVWYELVTPTTEQYQIPVLPSYYPFTNAWCDSELQSNITWNALTGRSSILDGLGNLIKEAPMTAPQNILINGDFQCWQRGDTLTIKNAEYGPDCWRSYALNATGITIEKVDNGMKIKSLSGVSICNFYQYITDKNLNGKKAMFAYSVNDKITSKLLTLNLSSGKDNQCSINDLKVNDIVNWAHLYLGEINYEHQKEDKAIALMRCYENIVCFKGYGNQIGIARSKGDNVMECNITLPMMMMKNPVINGSTISVTGIGTINSYTNIKIAGNYLFFNAILPSGTKPSDGVVSTMKLQDNNPMIISCEQL